MPSLCDYPAGMKSRGELGGKKLVTSLDPASLSFALSFRDRYTSRDGVSDFLDNGDAFIATVPTAAATILRTDRQMGASA
jgi:hypothetical protein